ncbi:hypothetical protein C0992_010494 [Termitomyces sp. T32_za158]|nr:hypothetical protein C0992_010494 [Termitomyces sp. T32_za158]
MSTSAPIKDGHPHPRTNSMASSPSQPRTPSSSTASTSPAITAGTERLLALFRDEMARIEAQHKKQMDDFAARFDDFRYFSAQEQLKLVDRIYLLEAELAARGVDMPPLETDRHVPEPRDGGAHGQTDAISNMDILDTETIHLVRALARLVKGADLTPGAPRALENISLSASYVPALFLPVLSQYLASHRMALRDLQEKHHAVEREHNYLRETMQSVTPPPSRLPAPSKTNTPPATYVPSPLRREARENSNSTLGAGTSIS